MSDVRAQQTDELPVIRLKIERRSSHPWIFQKMVEKPNPKPRCGTVVDIEQSDGAWVARGLYNGHSRIALRVLTTNRDEAIDEAFFERRLEAAIRHRRETLNLDAVTNAYRLVHSEGDNLSGLVIDRYGDTIVMEFFSAGMYRFKPVIQSVLERHFPGSNFYWFAEEHVQKQESIDCRSPAPPKPFVINEHGVKFWVAPGSKHKTGFFCDQRDNRRYFAQFCKDKRVLDICCNTGGFAVYAKTIGQAREVVGLDLDESVIDIAQKNARLNDNAKIRFVQVDLFVWLRDALQKGDKYDVVMLDPAKQTRDRDEVDMALRRYADMNKLAMMCVAPGGIFATCSCTGLVQEHDFIDAVRRAAWQAGRDFQVMKISGAGEDHPFMAHCQESRYLKCLWGRVW